MTDKENCGTSFGSSASNSTRVGFYFSDPDHGHNDGHIRFGDDRHHEDGGRLRFGRC